MAPTPPEPPAAGQTRRPPRPGKVPGGVQPTHPRTCPLFLTPYGLDGIRPLDRITGKCCSREGGCGIATRDPCGLGLEVEHEVGLPVVVHILHMPLLVRLRGPLRAEADAQRVDQRGIEGVGGQDGHGDHPVALGVNGIGGAAGFDVERDGPGLGLQLKGADITRRRAVAVAIHRARLAPLIGERGSPWASRQTGPPASMAGLPGTRAWVWVGPPLSASVGSRMSGSRTPAGGTTSVGPGLKPTTPALPSTPKRLWLSATTVP